MNREKIKTADGVLGTGSVELYDGLTGKLYRREKFENFLSWQTLMYQRQAIRADYQRNILAPQSTQDPAPQPTLTHLVAWDDNTPESPATEVCANGRMIAFANKTAFGGADPQRGGINMAESFNSPTQMKWVFDWPTTSANGTFQSVGWQALNESWYAGAYAVPVPHQGWNQKANNTLGQVGMGTSGWATFQITTVPATDKMYVANNGTVYEVNPTTGALIGAQLFTNAGEIGLAYDASGTPGFWMAKTAAAVSPCLVKRNLAGTIVDQVNTTWTDVFGTGVQPYSIAHDGTYLYAIRSGASIIYKITPANGAASSFSVATDMANVDGIGVDPFGIVATAKSHATNTPYGESVFIITRWSSTGKFLGKWMISNGGNEPNYNSGGIAYRASTFQHVHSYMYQSALYMRHWDLRCLGTRTLLGAPVTKDITKSMKINYTFSFV